MTASIHTQSGSPYIWFCFRGLGRFPGSFLPDRPAVVCVSVIEPDFILGVEGGAGEETVAQVCGKGYIVEAHHPRHRLRQGTSHRDIEEQTVSGKVCHTGT